MAVPAGGDPCGAGGWRRAPARSRRARSTPRAAPPGGSTASSARRTSPRSARSSSRRRRVVAEEPPGQPDGAERQARRRDDLPVPDPGKLDAGAAQIEHEAAAQRQALQRRQGGEARLLGPGQDLHLDPRPAAERPPAARVRLAASRSAEVATATTRGSRPLRARRRNPSTASTVSSTAVRGSVPGRPPPSRVWTRVCSRTRNSRARLTRARTKRAALEPSSIRAISSARGQAAVSRATGRRRPGSPPRSR